MDRRRFLSFFGLAPLAALPSSLKRDASPAMSADERRALDEIAEFARVMMPDRRGYKHQCILDKAKLARFHDALDAIGTPKTPTMPEM